MATTRTSPKQAAEKLGLRVLELERLVVDREAQIRDLEAQLRPDTHTENLVATSAEALRQHKAMAEAQIAERDAKITALTAQVQALAARTGRPVVRETPASVKALPVLQADPKTGRCLCPTNAEHGSVSPNVKGLCPKCFVLAVKAASPAGQAAAAAAAA